MEAAAMIPGFRSQLDVRHLEGEGTWELLSDLLYDSALIVPARLVVPAGFVTDFASIPRWVPLLYATLGGTGEAAATLHDHLYQTQRFRRETADRLFKEALRSLGLSAWRCWVMWSGVRAFGTAAYQSGPARYRVMNQDDEAEAGEVPSE